MFPFFTFSPLKCFIYILNYHLKVQYSVMQFPIPIFCFKHIIWALLDWLKRFINFFVFAKGTSIVYKVQNSRVRIVNDYANTQF